MRKSKYPEIANTLGQKIRKKRMDLGLSLVDVAKKAEITEGYLSRIEADKQRPLAEIAELLEKALGVGAGEYTSYTMPKFNKIDNDLVTKYKNLVVGLKKLINDADTELANYSPKDKKKILSNWKKTYEDLAADIPFLEKKHPPFPRNLI